MRRHQLVDDEDEVIQFVEHQCAAFYHQLVRSGDEQVARDNMETLLAQIGHVLAAGDMSEQNQQQLQSYYDSLADAVSGIAIAHEADAQPLDVNQLSPDDIADINSPLAVETDTGGRPRLVLPPQVRPYTQSHFASSTLPLFMLLLFHTHTISVTCWLAQLSNFVHA